MPALLTSQVSGRSSRALLQQRKWGMSPDPDRAKPPLQPGPDPPPWGCLPPPPRGQLWSINIITKRECFTPCSPNQTAVGCNHGELKVQLKREQFDTRDMLERTVRNYELRDASCVYLCGFSSTLWFRSLLLIRMIYPSLQSPGGIVL